jgi:hypothetical protein
MEVDEMARPELQDYDQGYDHDVGDNGRGARSFRRELETYERRGREFAQQRPFVALGLAMLAGYLFGRIVSRG